MEINFLPLYNENGNAGSSFFWEETCEDLFYTP